MNHPGQSLFEIIGLDRPQQTLLPRITCLQLKVH